MKEIELAYLQSAAHVHALLRANGHYPVRSPAVLAAALELPSLVPRADLLDRAREFFSAKAVIVPSCLEQLPAAWRSALPLLIWNSRKPHWTKIPYMISRLANEDGVLCVAFAQELPITEDRLTAWDKLRLNLNLGLSPNLWQPLSFEQERMIWSTHPELRYELLRLPD